MTIHYNWKPLSDDEFTRRIQDNCASSFMTLISIIQGVAFYFLLNNAVPIFSHGQTSWWFLAYPLLSFTSIVMVFYLYHFFISITCSPPNLRESLIVFVLGLSEILPMHFSLQPKIWWGLFSLFCMAGIVALWNTFRGLRVESFGVGREEAYIRSRWEEAKDMILSFCLFIIAVGAFLWYPEPPPQPLQFGPRDWVPVSLVLIVTAVMGFLTQFYYLKPLYTIYGLTRQTARTKIVRGSDNESAA